MTRSLRLACLSLLVLGCPGRAGESVARLVEARQTVEWNREPAKDWKPSQSGETYAVGDSVRTGAGSTARLEIVGGGGLLLGEKALVRFGRGDQRIGVAMGVAQVEGGPNAPVRVSTGNGAAIVPPGAQVRVSASEGIIHFDVLVGSATIEQGGATRSLTAGQTIDVEVGGAIVERKPDAAPPPADAAPVTDAAPPAPVEGVVKALLKGRGAQARPDEESPWKNVSGEVEMTPGTHVKLGPRATAELSRGDEKTLVRGVAELTIGPAGGPLAIVQRGGITVLATTTPTRVDLAGGSVTARKAAGAGSRADLNVFPKRDVQVAVRSGLVDIKGRGMAETLGAGETAALTVGGDVRFAGKPPDYADFSIAAGESPVVHDPRPPTAIRIRFGKDCPKVGVVEASRRGRWDRPESVSRGEGAANILIPVGGMQYRVRCVTGEQVDEAVKSKGTIHVLGDRGVAPIPKRAPKNVVDADGRKYTVLYQNLLPQLTFRWRNPPTSEVQLKIANGSGPEQTMPAPGAQVALESGALAEGVYQIWFEALSDARIRSPKTALVIDFDNAAPTASLRDPPPTGFSASPVKVAGVALEGWSVSVGGTALKSDARLRFSGDVTPSGDERAIAIRFVHPARGVHYYVRRRSP